MEEATQKTARRVVERLKQAGYEAYWVGGCVRNRLLGLEPKDYDIATSARPDDVSALFERSKPVGAHFGVVIVVEDEAPYEVATFRSDGRYLDRRRPEDVSFGSLEDDAGRRDFTINALYYDPVDDRTIDLFGGRQDLEDRLLRCIGDPGARFDEDALRLMRAVRFAVRFGLTIHDETFAAIGDRARHINDISVERVREELVAMMTGPRPGEALELLSNTGLLAEILPEVEAMRGVEQPPEFHPEGDVFVHTCLAMDALDEPTPTLAMATLLHDVGKPPTFRRGPDRIRFDLHSSIGAEMADDICRRLRFPNREREAIAGLVDRHMKFMAVRDMKASKLKRFLALPSFDEDLALHRADCVASHGDTSNAEFCEARREEFRQEEEEILPPPLIDGHDLIEQGYEPGPIFRVILDAVGEEQLEDALTTRDEALEWVRERYPIERGRRERAEGAQDEPT